MQSPFHEFQFSLIERSLNHIEKKFEKISSKPHGPLLYIHLSLKEIDSRFKCTWTCAVLVCCTHVYELTSWGTRPQSQNTHVTTCPCPCIPMLCMDVYARPYKPPMTLHPNIVFVTSVECTS